MTIACVGSTVATWLDCNLFASDHRQMAIPKPVSTHKDSTMVATQCFSDPQHELGGVRWTLVGQRLGAAFPSRRKASGGWCPADKASDRPHNGHIRAIRQR